LTKRHVLIAIALVLLALVGADLELEALTGGEYGFFDGH
jgi:hypothetical protein